MNFDHSELRMLAESLDEGSLRMLQGDGHGHSHGVHDDEEHDQQVENSNDDNTTL